MARMLLKLSLLLFATFVILANCSTDSKSSSSSSSSKSSSDDSKTVVKSSSEETVKSSSTVESKSKSVKVSGSAKESHEGDVLTIYHHLNEIILKLIGHKKKFRKTYKSDLLRLEANLVKRVQSERRAKEEHLLWEKNSASASERALIAKKAWLEESAKLTEEKRDSVRLQSVLKKDFESSMSERTKEIKMIKYIQCLISEFNKDSRYKCNEKGKQLVVNGKKVGTKHRKGSKKHDEKGSKRSHRKEESDDEKGSKRSHRKEESDDEKEESHHRKEEE